MLYGIFILFWLLAGLEFLLGRSNGKPKISFNLLHAAKLVSYVRVCTCDWRECMVICIQIVFAHLEFEVSFIVAALWLSFGVKRQM